MITLISHNKNGSSYTFKEFKSIEVSASLDSMARSFSLSLYPSPKWRERLNFNNLSIYVDNRLFLTGSIDTLDHSFEGSETINLSGRSAISHVLDSSYTGESEHLNIELTKLVRRVLKGFNLSLDFNITRPYTFEKFQTDSGQDIHSILNRIAIEAQVFYSELPDGTLRIFQEVEKSIFNLSLSNIKTRSYAVDKAALNSEIIVRGQSGKSGKSELQIEATAKNEVVQSYRPLIVTNQYVTKESAKALAEWLVAGQVAKALKFSYSMILNARVPLGKLIRIDDDLLNIADKFVISSVSHSQDATSGSSTKVSLVKPEAFEFEPYIKKLESQGSKKYKKKEKRREFVDTDNDGESDSWVFW